MHIAVAAAATAIPQHTYIREMYKNKRGWCFWSGRRRIYLFIYYFVLNLSKGNKIKQTHTHSFIFSTELPITIARSVSTKMIDVWLQECAANVKCPFSNFPCLLLPLNHNFLYIQLIHYIITNCIQRALSIVPVNIQAQRRASKFLIQRMFPSAAEKKHAIQNELFFQTIKLSICEANNFNMHFVCGMKNTNCLHFFRI